MTQLWPTLIILGPAGLLIGIGLSIAARRWQDHSDTMIERINKLLPQTQCEQCGHPGCRPYARAIARGEADINRCPPGGDTTIRALADLLGKQVKALDSSCGEHKAPLLAVIDEQRCIGCTLCIQACPVDAIAGAAKWMHTVIAAECTGCELCLPPCPVDCIDLVSLADQPQRRIPAHVQIPDLAA
jgi:electron transport complex protein RnfB